MSTDRQQAGRLAAGVIGVGSMGANHARVYNELPDTTLIGVHDIDVAQAADTAKAYRARAMDRDEMLDAVDIASVAVPTANHAEAIEACIDKGVHVLVEKPFVDDIDRGWDLAKRASEAGVTLQVGHIERFNPATRVLEKIVPDLNVIAIDIDRLGPPLDRENEDTVVMDLMIHDLDILLSLVNENIEKVSAAAPDEEHVTAQFAFEGGSIASLTASRRTQQKVRKLSITAESCRVTVDFISQSVEIHRRSVPEYVESNGDIRHRQESVVERPIVENGEPLKAELSAFAEAVTTGAEPLVTAEEALEVLAVLERIEEAAFGPSKKVVQ